MSAISIKNLHKNYGKTIAVNGINLEIEKGEFFGLLGPNGAGKTTTINILTGLANQTSGTVKLFGKDVVEDYKEARALIGLVPQEFNFSIFETVFNVLDFNGGYFGIPKKKRHARIDELLKQLGLFEKRNTKMNYLSGGMKRKVMIARALIHKPKILILDEPTAGVDVETRKLLWEYLKKLNKQGTTILLTTHYIEEAEELCERIAIVHKSNIIKVENKEDLLKSFNNQKLEEIFLQLTKE